MKRRRSNFIIGWLAGVGPSDAFRRLITAFTERDVADAIRHGHRAYSRVTSSPAS
jgi:hypothetical protein